MGELPENNLMWTENTKPTLYKQWLAWQITIDHSINTVDGVEPVETMEPDRFQGKIVVQAKKNVIDEAKKYRPGLVMWTDGSKLDLRVGVAVCWREKTLDLWKEKGVFLGKNKEILDAELWAIMIALDFTAKETLDANDVPVTIFCDSQKVLKVVGSHPSHKGNRFLRGLIYKKAEKLESNRHHFTLR